MDDTEAAWLVRKPLSAAIVSDCVTIDRGLVNLVNFRGYEKLVFIYFLSLNDLQRTFQFIRNRYATLPKNKDTSCLFMVNKLKKTKM